MFLGQYLDPSRIKIVSEPFGSKIQAINKVVDFLVESSKFDEEQREFIEECILYRERQKSTGMSNCIALPHGKTDRIQGFHVILLVCPLGVDFDTLDYAPAKFILGSVSDYENSSKHIRFLASMRNILEKKDVSENILSATSSKEIARILHRESRDIDL